MISPVADVRPFRALRYSPEVDLSLAVCPPFDIISPQQQRSLHDRSPYNAVRIELALPQGDHDRYSAAAATLDEWRDKGAVRVDDTPAYYLHEQRFQHRGRTYTRRMVFARVRLHPWSDGVVLPHEQTFGAPKEDRLKLLRATNLQASPVFMIYRDQRGDINGVLEHAASSPPLVSFDSPDGESHSLRLVTREDHVRTLHEAFRDETLYIADGHHRYETLLGFRDEVKQRSESWTGDEAPSFAMAGLSAAGDPGMLVLPIHRITAAGAPWEDAVPRIKALFTMEEVTSAEALEERLRAEASALGLIVAGMPAPLLLTVADQAGVDALLPQDRTPNWRSLDYSIANHAVMQHALGLTDEQMHDYATVWFSEDAAEAEREVRSGKARYAVLLNPIPVDSVLDLADEGERMPQKSTFFYPKLPTGLLFNPLDV